MIRVDTPEGLKLCYGALDQAYTALILIIDSRVADIALPHVEKAMDGLREYALNNHGIDLDPELADEA